MVILLFCADQNLPLFHKLFLSLKNLKHLLKFVQMFHLKILCFNPIFIVFFDDVPFLLSEGFQQHPLLLICLLNLLLVFCI